MKIYTKYDEDLKKFKDLKKSAIGEFIFFLSGEWSNMTSHSDSGFYYYLTSDKKLCFIECTYNHRHKGICAIADDFNADEIEIVLGKMLKEIRVSGGPSIDTVDMHSEGDKTLNLNKILDEYWD